MNQLIALVQGQGLLSIGKRTRKVYASELAANIGQTIPDRTTGLWIGSIWICHSINQTCVDHNASVSIADISRGDGMENHCLAWLC